MAQEGRGHRFYAAVFAVSLLLVGLAATAAVASPSTPGSICGLTASVSVDPTSGDAGTPAVVSGTGYCPLTEVRIRFLDAGGVLWPLVNHVAVGIDTTFSVTVTIPNDAAIGIGKVKANDRLSQQCASVDFEVTAPG